MISDDDVLRAEGYAQAYVEVIRLLDTEIDKWKLRGDRVTAEVVEILRAKLSAQGKSV